MMEEYSSAIFDEDFLRSSYSFLQSGKQLNDKTLSGLSEKTGLPGYQ